jgi:hypothetical protein
VAVEGYSEGVKLAVGLLVSVVVAVAAESDALRLDSQIRSRHMPHAGLLSPVYASPDSDEIVTYSRCGDSAIWTGHYLAAQSYRYRVTRDPEALDNIRAALHGLRILFDVTGNDTLARCAFPENAPYAADVLREEHEHTSFQGIVDGQKWTFVSNVSRDQWLGVYFGFTVCWNLVDDPEIREIVRWLAVRGANSLLKRNWILRDPNGSISTTFIGRADQQLMILKLVRRLDEDHFGGNYRSMSLTLAPATIVPVSLEVREPYTSYFKFNLDHIAFYGLLSSGDNWYVRSNYEKGWDILRNTLDDHGNAFFDLIAREIEGPNEGRDEGIRQMLNQWLERPARDVWVDLRNEVELCAEDRSCSPIPVNRRVTTDFVWQRSPFQVLGGGYGVIETAGIDYILPYWMARYHGIVND